MELNAKNIKKILLLSTFAIVLFWAVQNLSQVIAAGRYVLNLASPFLIGLAVAFVLSVPIEVKGTGDKAGGLSLIQVSGDGDARTLACDLLTQAYALQKAQDGAFSVTGTDDRLSEALGADAAAIEEAVAGKAAEVSPQAAGATWDKEVWLDYAGNVASTTFTLDDPASTVVTVVSRGGSLEAM